MQRFDKLCIFSISDPSIGATLVNSIYILGDTILVGRGVGSMGIAALNLLLPVFSLFLPQECCLE